MLTATGTIRTRMNFAIQHMLAAARFSRRCAEIERENQGKVIDYFFDEVIHCCTAAIFFSVASIEANINELFVDSDQHFPNQTPDLIGEFLELLKDKPILEKYQSVLVLKDVSKFDQGRAPYQDVDSLIKARNALVHFKPEWNDEQKVLKGVGDRLNGKFSLSPFVDQGEPTFPQRCMSHGCASWAVRSSLAFMEAFHQAATLPHKFALFAGNLDPA